MTTKKQSEKIDAILDKITSLRAKLPELEKPIYKGNATKEQQSAVNKIYDEIENLMQQFNKLSKSNKVKASLGVSVNKLSRFRNEEKSSLQINKIVAWIRSTSKFINVEVEHIDESTTNFVATSKEKQITIDGDLLRNLTIQAKKDNQIFSIVTELKTANFIFTERSFT